MSMQPHHPVRSLLLIAGLLTPLVVMTAAAPVGAASPPTVSVSASGQQRTLPTQFFGFNAEDIKTAAGSNLWFGPKIPSDIAKLHGSLLRIPGGTTSQWIDWTTGLFINNPDDPFTNTGRNPITLGDWANIVKESGTVPVFDLDVVNSTLGDQLAMLSAAASLGMPIKYVELGNELWDPTESTYTSLYPTGAAYGLAMNPWIAAIKAAYPSAQVAVCGEDSSQPLYAGIPRMATWNASMLSVVTGEDAVTFHPYWVLPPGNPAGSVQSEVQTPVSGLTEWSNFSSETLPTLPAGVTAWLTEWNQADFFHQGGHQSWVQALTVAAFAADNAADPQVDMSLVHDVVDQANNPLDPVPALSEQYPSIATNSKVTKATGFTANGYALSTLFGSVTGGDQVQTLNFTNGPSVGSVIGLVGIETTNPDGRTAYVLINLSDQSVTADLSGVGSRHLTAKSLTDGPLADPGFMSGGHPTKSTAKAKSATGFGFQLPEYSITIIKS